MNLSLGRGLIGLLTKGVPGIRTNLDGGAPFVACMGMHGGVIMCAGDAHCGAAQAPHNKPPPPSTFCRSTNLHTSWSPEDKLANACTELP